jgi:hypothetical protein
MVEQLIFLWSQVSDVVYRLYFVYICFILSEIFIASDHYFMFIFHVFFSNILLN